MKNCTSCGNELADNAVMCVKCGTKISGEALSGSTVSDFNFMNKVKIGLILIAICKGLQVLFSSSLYFDWIYANDLYNSVYYKISMALPRAGIIAGIILVLLTVIQIEKELPKK